LTSPDFLKLKQGPRGPNMDDAAWAYKEMAQHASMEWFSALSKNPSKWTPIWNDFDLSMLTLCNTDVNQLLTQYNQKLTDALNGKG
jgi:hypothetical protein